MVVLIALSSVFVAKSLILLQLKIVKKLKKGVDFGQPLCYYSTVMMIESD